MEGPHSRGTGTRVGESSVLALLNSDRHRELSPAEMVGTAGRRDTQNGGSSPRGTMSYLRL